MIELVFIACLSTLPANCEERHLLYHDITPMECLMGAQPELARWAASHPRWRIARWHCQTLRPGEKDA